MHRTVWRAGLRAGLALLLLAGSWGLGESLQPPPGLQVDPAISSHRGEPIALWTDERIPGETRLYCAWLEGFWPATEAGPLVPNTGAVELHPSVAAGADWGLVVWEAWSDPEVRVRGAEIPPAGSVGPVPSFPISDGTALARRPSVAIRDRTAVVVWEESAEFSVGLRVARWDRDAGLRDPGGTSLLPDPGERHWPRVAAGEVGFLVTWSEREIRGTHRVRVLALDANGEPLDASRSISSPLATSPVPAVAHAGGRYLVVWREPDGGARLVGRLLDEGGSPVDAIRVVIDNPDSEFNPRLTSTGEGFGLAWQALGPRGRELRRAWVDGDGIAHPRAGVPVVPPGSNPADPEISAAGEKLWVAWRRPVPEDEDDLYMIQVPVRDTLLSPAPVLLTAIATVGVRPGLRPPRLRAAPNPFSSRVRIEADGEPVRVLEIFDLLGRRVRRVERATKGDWWWDGRGENGLPSPPGVYLARAGGSSVRLIRLP